MEGLYSRRQFLRVAAGAGAAATLAACNSGSDEPKEAAAAGNKGRRTLRIAQMSHFVPAYDVWFDNEYTKQWGEAHDVDVVVDHIPYDQAPARADTEVAARRGHDIFGFVVPAARFMDDAIDHTEIVEEITKRVGPLTPHMERSVRSAKTGRFFAVPDWWACQPSFYRTDLWAAVGTSPDSWDNVVKAAAPLKAAGAPLGVGFSNDFDSALALTTLLFCHGASIQDENGQVALGRAATVEAVKVGAELYRRGNTADSLNWDGSGDNRFLASGQGSFTLDAVSALRAIEQQNPDLARTIAMARPPSGPGGSLSPPIRQCYVIWQFAEEPEVAKEFVVDLVADYREPFRQSQFYNLPASPKSVPDLSLLVADDPAADPRGKYSLLAGAADWTTNLGHPGSDNPAVDDVVNAAIIPRMFSRTALGEISAADAVEQAGAEAEAIFAKWRERGKI